MSLNAEDLLNISQLLDKKLSAAMEPVQSRLDKMDARMDSLESLARENQKEIRKANHCLENEVLPRLGNIEECYTSTYERYQKSADAFDYAIQDIAIVKTVVAEHGKRIGALEAKG
jgi:hypothetical protein